jgi:drug/metabolite transporter (DMT)-like permease
MQEPSASKTMGLQEWGLVLTLSVIWGGSFFFIGVAVKSLPSLTLVFLRVALAAVVLNLLVPAIGLRMPGDRKTWTAFFAMGFLNNLLPFSLIVWGQTYIASGLASILHATTPVFTVIVAHLIPVSAILLGSIFLGEQLAWRHFLGMALIGAGLAAIDGRLLAPMRLQKLSAG